MLEKTPKQKWSILYLWEQFGAESNPKPIWGAGCLAVAGWPPVTAWLAGRGCLVAWLTAWLRLNQKA